MTSGTPKVVVLNVALRLSSPYHPRSPHFPQTKDQPPSEGFRSNTFQASTFRPATGKYHRQKPDKLDHISNVSFPDRIGDEAVFVGATSAKLVLLRKSPRRTQRLPRASLKRSRIQTQFDAGQGACQSRLCNRKNFVAAITKQLEVSKNRESYRATNAFIWTITMNYLWETIP